MSVARTARRRRKQYKNGNLDQTFGKRAAPIYKKKEASTLAKREALFRERQKKIQQRSKK